MIVYEKKQIILSLTNTEKEKYDAKFKELSNHCDYIDSPKLIHKKLIREFLLEWDIKSTLESENVIYDYEFKKMIETRPDSCDLVVDYYEATKSIAHFKGER